MLKVKNLIHPLKRFLSTSSSNIVEHLSNRSLIRVSGSDVANYLQGLITNDIEHLSTGPGSMYALFLNSTGRVLSDVIIYRSLEANTFLIECDKQGSETLQKHLKLYRVRRKIDITNLDDKLKIYVLFNDSNTQRHLDISDGSVPCQKPNKDLQQITFKTHQDLLVYRDPRVVDLGFRILAGNDANITEQLRDIVSVQKDNTSGKNYRWLRYSLGVGEGIEDLPPGNCLPLDCNGDYLHGISFHKGCYIGQEVVAKSHYTLEVRKRLMPIHFTTIPTKLPDKKIVHENVNLGRLRGIEQDVGLALLKYAEALSIKKIKLGDGVAVVSRPSWWPFEAPKGKVNISKLE